MPYLSLYRKYRPRSFAEVVGQRHVTQTLANAVRSERIAHAYLFAGPRGTGKTSTARVLAMALNCEEGTSAEPCGKCEPCRRIISGSALDVIEIDAASNRGIDEIRELRERVGLAPADSRYKVYIIDEVHMLTGEAFNAFLKTLEEPPKHVIFVLATTEPHRVLPTILSRCQRFDFHRIGMPQIETLLKWVAEQEGITVDEKAVAILAHAADGSVRDSLTLFDQAIAYAEGPVTAEVVSEILGGIDFDLLSAFTATFTSRDAGGALALIDRVAAEGKDLKQLLMGLIGHYRNLLLLAVDRRGAEALALPEELTQRVAEQARALTADEIVHGLDLLAETDREMRFTSQPRLLVELMAVRLCGSAAPLGAATPEPPAAAAPAVGARPAVPSPTPTARRVPAPPPAPEPKPTEAVGEPTPSRNETETLAELRRRWEEILSALRKLRSVKIEAFLREATPTGLQEGVLTLTFRFQFHYSQMATSEERRKVLSDAIARVIGTTVTIKCELADGEEAQPPASPNQPKLIQDVLSTFPGSTVEE